MSKRRASAVIIKDDQVLLIRRVKEDREYYVFPGGSIEEGESPEEAIQREVAEELSLAAKVDRFLFQLVNQGREEVYYLIREFSGTSKVSSPESERMHSTNQYHPTWVNLSRLGQLANLYPEEATRRVKALWDGKKI